MVTQIKQWSDRKKKTETPLIPSYVFVNIEEKNRNDVFEVPGVVRYLFWLEIWLLFYGLAVFILFH